MPATFAVGTMMIGLALTYWALRELRVIGKNAKTYVSPTGPRT